MAVRVELCGGYGGLGVLVGLLMTGAVLGLELL
jgi:hypothetical protein